MTGGESPAILRRVKALEQATGRRVVLRGLHPVDETFRGRVVAGPGLIVLEYRDDTAGYYWHYPIIESLLSYAESGCLDVVVHEGE